MDGRRHREAMLRIDAAVTECGKAKHPLSPSSWGEAQWSGLNFGAVRQGRSRGLSKAISLLYEFGYFGDLRDGRDNRLSPKTSWPRRRPSTTRFSKLSIAIRFGGATSSWCPMRECRQKQPCVYMLASKPNGVIYIGVTSDLRSRVSVHKQDLIDGFTKRYGVHQLVYYEMLETMEAAIRRETQIKKWKRAWKVRLIQAMNPEWSNLFDDRTGELFDPRAEIARFDN